MSSNYSEKIFYFAEIVLSAIFGTEIHFNDADILPYAEHFSVASDAWQSAVGFRAAPLRRINFDGKIGKISVYVLSRR